MSTDYTHFTNLAFSNLFSRGADGSEIQIVNSSGAFVGTVATTGTITVTKVTTSAGTVGAPAIAVGSSTLGFYRAAAKQLGIAAAGVNIATITTAALLVAKALTVTGAISGSNLSGTNTGDNVNAGSATVGLMSTGSQSFAGAKTFLSTIVGSINGNAATVTTNANLTGPITSVGNATAIASSVITNVMISPSAAIAGSKIVSASTSAAGVLTTGAQSIGGAKTFVGGIKYVSGLATLAYYDSGTFNIDFNALAGSGGSSTAFVASYVRIGDHVSIKFPAMTGMKTGSSANASFSTASGTVPAAIRPPQNQYGCYLTSVSSATTNAGIWNILTNGTILLYREPTLTTTWPTTNSGNGAFGFTASWNVT